MPEYSNENGKSSLRNGTSTNGPVSLLGSEGGIMASVEEIVRDVQNGRMILLVDAPEDVSECHLVAPAQMATPDAINFMAKFGRGLICLSLTRARAERLHLQLMNAPGDSRRERAFTASIEAKVGVTTGISAHDRARTISVAIDGKCGADDIVSPGHVFPLIAREGGVLMRAGYTEASVDIARLAGLNPAGVICQVMTDEGGPAQMEDVVALARTHKLKIGTIQDLIAYRMCNDRLVKLETEGRFQSDIGGDWAVKCYRNMVDGSANLVLQKGMVDPEEATLVRMHNVSIFDDVLGRPGPRRGSLQRAMAEIGEAGSGIIVLIRADDQTLLSADEDGFPTQAMDFRNYGVGAQILLDLGVRKMVLLINRHRHMPALRGFHLNVVGERLIKPPR